jgi:hypothetical protein
MAAFNAIQTPSAACVYRSVLILQPRKLPVIVPEVKVVVVAVVVVIVEAGVVVVVVVVV